MLLVDVEFRAGEQRHADRSPAIARRVEGGGTGALGLIVGGLEHGLKPGDLFWEYNGDRIFPHDGYLPRMRADQAQGLVQPVIVYRPDVGFFPIYMQPDKQGWGVSTRPVTRVPGQESEPTGDWEPVGREGFDPSEATSGLVVQGLDRVV